MSRVIRERVLVSGPSGDGFDAIEAGQVRNRLDTMPTVIAGNYTKQLSNYDSLTAAIADLPDGGAQGGEIQVEGELPATDLHVPAKVHMVGKGAGATALFAPQNNQTPVITLDGASGAVVADLAIMGYGDIGGALSHAVYIIGDSEDITLDRLHIDQFRGNVHVDGNLGTTPGMVRHLKLNSVRSDWSRDAMGYVLRYVDGVVLVSCTGNDNWLDGLKLQEQVLNLTDIAGTYDRNGKSYTNTEGRSKYVADGVDGYAGGKSTMFFGTTADDNSGYGILFKTDMLSTTPDMTPGVVEFHGVRARGNQKGHGLAVAREPYLSEVPIAFHHAAIFGGDFSDNYFDGVLVDAWDVTLNGPLTARNGRDGIRVYATARDVMIANPRSYGNGVNKAIPTEFTGVAYGIHVQGKRVAVRGGSVYGIDMDTAHNDADRETLTRTHDYNVYVDANADDVEVALDHEGYHSGSGLGMRTTAPSGRNVRLHHKTKLTQNPAEIGATGGIGSTFIRVNQAGRNLQFVKRTGTPDVSTGWFRPGAADVAASTPTPTAEDVGSHIIVGVTGYLCIESTPGVYQWKQVTP